MPDSPRAPAAFLTALGLIALATLGILVPTTCGAADPKPLSSGRSSSPTPHDGWSGVLLPGQTAFVKSKIEDRVAEAPVPAGRMVKKGDLLLRFVDDEYKVGCDRAAALSDRAESAFKRAEELHRQGSISHDEFEKVQTDLKIARADYDLAKIRLRERTIVAPFDGVLAERFVDAGGSVKEGDPLLRVTSITPLRVEALLPEEALPRLKRAGRIEVSLVSPETTFTLAVPHLPMVVDPASGMLQLHVEVDNARGRLIPGVSCRVRIPERAR